MGHLGPTSARELGQILGLLASEIDKALLRLEATGAILRGKFTDGSSGAGTPARGSSPDSGSIGRESQSKNVPLLSEGHVFSRGEMTTKPERL